MRELLDQHKDQIQNSQVEMHGNTQGIE